jgi:hypothetical protein
LSRESFFHAAHFAVPLRALLPILPTEVPEGENSNIEARNPKQIQITEERENPKLEIRNKAQMTKQGMT